MQNNPIAVSKESKGVPKRRQQMHGAKAARKKACGMEVCGRKKAGHRERRGERE